MSVATGDFSDGPQTQTSPCSSECTPASIALSSPSPGSISKHPLPASFWLEPHHLLLGPFPKQVTTLWWSHTDSFLSLLEYLRTRVLFLPYLGFIVIYILIVPVCLAYMLPPITSQPSLTPGRRVQVQWNILEHLLRGWCTEKPQSCLLSGHSKGRHFQRLEKVRC